MHARNTSLKISSTTKEEGIASAHWFSIEAAKEIVRYDGNREVIERAEIILDQLQARQKTSNKSA